MSQAVYYVSYKLKKGTAVPDFLAAAKKLNDEYIAKQSGYIVWQQLRAGKRWADVITFETMDDLSAFEAASRTPNELAKKFYSCMRFFSFLNPVGYSFRKYEVVATHGPTRPAE
ncbi:MAG: hypothetical protein FWD83_01380 [Promicromonosporaceae bacterium]|nr:hypothetical protein [Promicromonosporaceae bacterium]